MQFKKNRKRIVFNTIFYYYLELRQIDLSQKWFQMKAYASGNKKVDSIFFWKKLINMN